MVGGCRHLFEKKATLRLATLAEFEEIRKESQQRLSKALKEQNEAAKKRNKELLEEILIEREVCHPKVTSDCKFAILKTLSVLSLNETLKASTRLQDEKARFSKYMEATNTAMQRNRNRILEEKIAEIKAEKIAADQRREKLRIQMLRENATK